MEREHEMLEGSLAGAPLGPSHGRVSHWVAISAVALTVTGAACLAALGMARGQEASPATATTTPTSIVQPLWPEGPNCPVRVDAVPAEFPARGVVLANEFILQPQPPLSGSLNPAQAVAAARPYETNSDFRVESVVLGRLTLEGDEAACPNPLFGHDAVVQDLPVWVVVFKAPHPFSDWQSGIAVGATSTTFRPPLKSRVIEILDARNGSHAVGFDLP